MFIFCKFNFCFLIFLESAQRLLYCTLYNYIIIIIIKSVWAPHFISLGYLTDPVGMVGALHDGTSCQGFLSVTIVCKCLRSAKVFPVHSLIFSGHRSTASPVSSVLGLFLAGWSWTAHWIVLHGCTISAFSFSQ